VDEPLCIANTPRLLLFLRRHYDDRRFSYALLALAGAIIFFLAAGAHPVFADAAALRQHQPQRHVYDAPVITQASGNSYTRQVSDSLSVAGYFHAPASKAFASRTTIRGISDGIGMRSEFGSPASGLQVTNPIAPRGSGPSLQQPNQRPEERLGQRILPGHKGESLLYNTAVTQSGTSTAELVSTKAGKKDFQDIAVPGDSGGGSDPDGNNSSRLLKSALAMSSSSAATNGMIAYSNATSGAYCFAVFALAVSKSPRLKAKRRTIRLHHDRFAIFSAQDLKRLRSAAFAGMIVVVVMVAAVAGLPGTTGPVVGQAYGDDDQQGDDNSQGDGEDDADDKQQAVPVYVGAGTPAGGTGTVTPTLPTGLQANDVLLLFVETANQASSISDSAEGTWAQVANSPQGTGIAGSALATRLTVFWSRYDGVQTAPTVADSGDHQVAVILAFRGVITSGNPWDVTSGNVDVIPDTNLYATGATTTVGNTLVVVASAVMTNTVTFSNWSNEELANITTRSIVSTTAGNTGGIAIITGEKTSAGEYEATAAKLSANSVKGMMTIALKPEPSTSRPASDTLTLSDSLSAKVVAKAVGDGVVVADTLILSVNPAIINSISVSDSIARSITRRIQEPLSVNDGVNNHVMATRSIADNLTLADAIQARVSTVAVSVADMLVVAEQPRTTSRAINIADLLTVVDTTGTSFKINISDSLNVADLRAAAINKRISDSLATTDRVTAAATPIFGDRLTMTDALSKRVTFALVDGLSLQDSLGGKMPVSIKISDSIKVAEGTKAGKIITIVDALTIGAEISDISILWNRNFDESLNLEDCDNFSCNQALHFDEGISMADALLTPPRFTETLMLGESITSSHIFTRNLSDPLSVSARPDYSVKLAPTTAPDSPLPPISVLVVSNKTNAGLPPSINVPIPPLSWKGDTNMLKEVLKPVPHVVNATVTKSDLPQMTMVLPMYRVPIVPSSEIPGKNVMLSVMAADVPANTPVMVPINMAEKQETKENAISIFAKSMSIEFTPNITTTNFALVVSVVDGPPGRVEPPPADLKPLYLDVRWIGDFPGKEDPHVAEYYKNPPTFTFTVTDEWATTQQSQRDENGIPVVSLKLLDDSSGKWETITDMRRPTSGVDGVYTYVATLPHFSNYAITANKAVVSKNPIVSTSAGMKMSPPVLPQLSNLAVNLADSVNLGDTQNTISIQTIEEFGRKELKVGISDSLAVLTKPLPYKTFQVNDVDVKITVQDVKQESIVPPKAAATFLVEMANSGDKHERFTLSFWYYDGTGKKWESSQIVELGPHESRSMTVSVPFASPGVFDVIAEARSLPGKDLVNATKLTVTVPWLTVNLYVVVVVAAVILGTSGTGIALLLGRTGMAALGGTGLLPAIILKKPKPRVRVTENPAADDDYDLVVRVKMKNGLEGEVMQQPAQFDLDVTNRSKSKQTFVLRYWAMDESGIRMFEHSEMLKVGARKTEKRSASLDLPGGTYIFSVEARPAEGDDVWSHTKLRLRVR
jgi:hypothetical protein